MAALTLAELEHYDVLAGWPQDLIPTAAAVEMAESGGNPQALNAPEQGIGLFQITPGTQADYDPLTNSKAALAKYQSQGWGAWTTWTGGQYRQFLGPAQQAWGTAGASPSSSAAANPGRCAKGTWVDAQCGPLDPGCAVRNWYGSLSCSVGGQLTKGTSALQIGFGLVVLAGAVGLFAYLFVTRTNAGRQLVSGAKTAINVVAA